MADLDERLVIDAFERGVEALVATRGGREPRVKEEHPTIATQLPLDEPRAGRREPYDLSDEVESDFDEEHEEEEEDDGVGTNLLALGDDAWDDTEMIAAFEQGLTAFGPPPSHEEPHAGYSEAEETLESAI